MTISDREKNVFMLLYYYFFSIIKLKQIFNYFKIENLFPPFFTFLKT